MEKERASYICVPEKKIEGDVEREEKEGEMAKNKKNVSTKLDAAGEMIFKKKKIKRVSERFDTFFQSKQR